MSTLVTGIFHSRAAAEEGVDDLVDAGYARDDISLLMSETTRGREFGVTPGSKAPEGIATGATVGGVLGAIAAGLVAAGVLVIPGVNLLAAGPAVAALAGLGAGAATGGIVGALVGLGIPENEAHFYKEQIERGGILLGVYTHGDRVREARRILDEAGAEKVR